MSEVDLSLPIWRVYFFAPDGRRGLRFVNGTDEQSALANAKLDADERFQYAAEFPRSAVRFVREQDNHNEGLRRLQSGETLVLLFDSGNEMRLTGDEALRAWNDPDEWFRTVLEKPLGKLQAMSVQHE